MIYCKSCGTDSPEGAAFCSKCGTKLELIPVEAPQVVNPVVDLENTTNFDDVSTRKVTGKKFSKKKLVTALVCVSLIAVAIPLNNTYQENKRIAAEKLAAELRAQSLTEAFESELLKENFTSCDSIKEIMLAAAYPELSAKAATSKEIRDAREALAFVSANSITKTDLKTSYLNDLNELITTDLKTFYSKVDRDDSAPEAQLNKWSGQWKEETLNSCNLGGENLLVDQSLSSLDAEFERITVLADSVPWYPEDFREYEEGIAIDFIPGGRSPCNDCVYWTLDLISQSGCPSGLYVEVTFSRGGSTFDWSNDTLPSLCAGDKGRLQFYTYEYGNSTSGMTIDISKVSCR